MIGAAAAVVPPAVGRVVSSRLSNSIARCAIQACSAPASRAVGPGVCCELAHVAKLTAPKLARLAALVVPAQLTSPFDL